MSEQKDLITIYNANILYTKSITEIYKKIFKDFWRNRELIYRLLLRNFSDKYRQSFLGWGWVFLMPIFTMGTFLALNISGVLSIGKLNVPYPIWGLLGFNIWNLFSNGLPSLTLSISILGNVVSKINVSKSAIVAAALAQVLVDFGIRMAFVLIVFLIYFRLPAYLFLLTPFLVLPLVIFVFGLGLIFSVLQVIFKDVINFVNLGLSMALFLTPVMYDLPKKGLIRDVNLYNPIYYMVSVPRDLIIFGSSSDLFPFFLSSIFSLIFMLTGMLFFYFTENKLSERI